MRRMEKNMETTTVAFGVQERYDLLRVFQAVLGVLEMKFWSQEVFALKVCDLG